MSRRKTVSSNENGCTAPNKPTVVCPKLLNQSLLGQTINWGIVMGLEAWSIVIATGQEHGPAITKWRIILTTSPNCSPQPLPVAQIQFSLVDTLNFVAWIHTFVESSISSHFPWLNRQVKAIFPKSLREKPGFFELPRRAKLLRLLGPLAQPRCRAKPGGLSRKSRRGSCRNHLEVEEPGSNLVRYFTN